MRFGKLNNEELTAYVLSKLNVTRDEVTLSAALGEDCAAFQADGTLLITSDPITAPLPPAELGALLIDVCCNDIAANGGTPLIMTVTVIVPPDTDPAAIGAIMTGAASRAKDHGVDIVGGHTEFSDCVTRPIVSGTALGTVARIIKKSGLRAGDRLYVTKKLAMEGTLLIAEADSSKRNEEEEALLKRLSASLSVVAESRVLAQLPCVSMMHDVTEGGILGAVSEVCLSLGLGAELFERTFPFEPLTLRLCRAHNIDPNRLVSSGSMLFAANSGAAVEALRESGIEVTEIGTVTKTKEIVLVSNGNARTRVTMAPDEMYKINRCL